MSRISRTSDPISRVKCIVDSCYYYQSEDQCMAEKIEVKPPNSSTSEETDCNTFKPKRGM